MGISFFSRYFFLLFLYLVFFVSLFIGTLAEKPSFFFSFKRFEEHPSSGSEIALYGDAKIIEHTVRITCPRASSAGLVMYRELINFGRNPSFSTYFSFSISPGKGDGLAFLIAPGNVAPKVLNEHLFGLSAGVLAVEFDTSMDPESNDLNGNHVGLDLGSIVSVKTANVSSIYLVLNSGEKLHSWIDFNGDSRILEVRLSKSGIMRPSVPFISYPIDLSGVIWKNAMSVGISSSSGNSTQTSTIHSWNFTLKHASPFLLHSEPLDPQSILETTKQSLVRVKRAYLPRIIAAVAFGVACGAMVALLVLVVWSAVVDRRPIAPVEEDPAYPVEFEYKTIVAAGEKGINGGTK